MSGLLISCSNPPVDGELESVPSTMKLLDRVRMPFTENDTPPEANVELPVESWLTPGTDSAALRMLPFGASGSSEMRLLSKFTPTSALVVLTSGTSAVTVTTSCALDTLSRAGTLARSLS